MEPEEYRLMFELEEKHWWYRALHDLLFSTINKVFGSKRNLQILDVGCGTGYVLKQLSQYGTAYGIDVSGIALEYCRKRGLKCVREASVLNIDFADNSFDLVVSLDVLYHKAVTDDERAINEICRVLKKDGVLILSLPAHDHLLRHHDKRVHARHRYSKEEVRDKMERNGFDVMKLSYRNALSYLALSLFKNFYKTPKNSETGDLKPVPGLINKTLYLLTTLENKVLENFGVPLGTSVFCAARKRHG